MKRKLWIVNLFNVCCVVVGVPLAFKFITAAENTAGFNGGIWYELFKTTAGAFLYVFMLCTFIQFFMRKSAAKMMVVSLVPTGFVAVLLFFYLMI